MNTLPVSLRCFVLSEQDLSSTSLGVGLKCLPSGFWLWSCRKYDIYCHVSMLSGYKMYNDSYPFKNILKPRKESEVVKLLVHACKICILYEVSVWFASWAMWKCI